MACVGGLGSGDPPKQNKTSEKFSGSRQTKSSSSNRPPIELDGDGKIILEQGDTLERMEVGWAQIPDELLQIRDPNNFVIFIADTELARKS